MNNKTVCNDRSQYNKSIKPLAVQKKKFLKLCRFFTCVVAKNVYVKLAFMQCFTYKFIAYKFVNY